jgi:uncharacterized membrane protein (DUF485 family)
MFFIWQPLILTVLIFVYAFIISSLGVWYANRVNNRRDKAEHRQ